MKTVSDHRYFTPGQEKAAQGSVHQLSDSPLDIGVEDVRRACVGAYRQRHLRNISWGVRDWSALRFEVVHVDRRVRVSVIGALEDSALRFFLWERLGSHPELDVVCRET